MHVMLARVSLFSTIGYNCQLAHVGPWITKLGRGVHICQIRVQKPIMMNKWTMLTLPKVWAE